MQGPRQGATQRRAFTVGAIQAHPFPGRVPVQSRGGNAAISPRTALGIRHSHADRGEQQHLLWPAQAFLGKILARSSRARALQRRAVHVCAGDAAGAASEARPSRSTTMQAAQWRTRRHTYLPDVAGRECAACQRRRNATPVSLGGPMPRDLGTPSPSKAIVPLPSVAMRRSHATASLGSVMG